MSLGTYPAVSLIADGVDPVATPQATKLAQAETFDGIAAE
jgi:hypothetical protein